MNISCNNYNSFLIANPYSIEEIHLSEKKIANITKETATNIIITDKVIIKRDCITMKKSDIFMYKQTEKLYKKILKVCIKSEIKKIKRSKNKALLSPIQPINNYCFFKEASIILHTLIIDCNFSNLQKIDILEDLSNLLDTANIIKPQKIIARFFIESVISCLKLCYHLNNLAIWNNSQKTDKFISTCYYNKNTIHLLSLDKNNIPLKQLFLYPLSIDLLCIEAEARFKYENDNTFDAGGHTFDNEWMYMERCYRGFLYLLNKQIYSINEISFNDLRAVNAILGSYVTPGTKECSSYYGINITKDQAFEFINLVKQGVISDELLQTQDDNLSHDERLIQLQDLLNSSLKTNIKLNKFFIKNNLYFLIDIENPNSKKVLKEHPQKLLNDLHGETNEKAFIFHILPKDKSNSNKTAFSLRVVYCYTKKRSKICQKLLDIYYHKIEEFPDNTRKKVSLAVGLCSLLQRIHPFADANGRTLFFILLPILLYQIGMWLTRMVREPWLDLELHPPEELADKIIDLCFPAPSFKARINWNKHITTAESMRIYCSLGDIQTIEKIIYREPELLNKTILLTPVIKPVTLLEFVIMHNQTEMFCFLLNKLSATDEVMQFNSLSKLFYLSQIYEADDIKDIILSYIKDTYNMVLVKDII